MNGTTNLLLCLLVFKAEIIVKIRKLLRKPCFQAEMFNFKYWNSQAETKLFAKLLGCRNAEICVTAPNECIFQYCVSVTMEARQWCSAAHQGRYQILNCFQAKKF